MRITHVIDYFHTDVGYQEYYLAIAQAQQGHDVAVVASTERHHSVAVPGPDLLEGSARLDRTGVCLTRLPTRQLGHDRAWLRGLTGALAETRPDVIHCHGPFSPTTVRTAQWCARQATPLLVDNHLQDWGTPGASSPLGRAVYLAYRMTLGNRLRRAVRDWVADGPYEQDFLARRLAIQKASIALVPLGFDPEVFRFDERQRVQIREREGWIDDIVVTTTGKLHQAKRVDLVAAACERVWPQERVRLVLAGQLDDAHRSDILAACPRLREEGRLDIRTMLGREDLADLYLGADVAVFPRLASISIYEAAGTGAKVVVPPSRFATWLASLHSGVVAAAPDELASALSPGSNRRALAAEAAAAFSWPVVAADFVERYRAIL